MTAPIRTQSDLIYQLCSQIEQAEKFNYNLERALIRLERVKRIYKDLPTQENAILANQLQNELNGVKPIDVKALEFKLNELVINN